jgi:hypothetical protein
MRTFIAPVIVMSIAASASTLAQDKPAAAPTAPSSPTPAAVPPPASDAVDKARLEKMLADGDDGMIVQVFKRHQAKTLPFIDRYLEGGLAMIEKGGDAAAAQASFRTGIKFAKLADEAFRDNVLTEYANAFASWSPMEQKAFREGQKEFKLGMDAAGAQTPDLIKALEHFKRSLALADSLGDTWGEAMAHSAIAETDLKLGRHEEGRVAAVAAIETNYKLRLQEDLIQSLLTCSAIHRAMGLPDGGVGHVRQAWMYAEKEPSIDAAMRERVFKELTAALERTGKKDEADQLRKDRGG